MPSQSLPMRRHQVVAMGIPALAWPAWMRPSFVVLFVATLFLHLWGLDRNGWANAEVEAGTRSWRARRGA